MDVPEHSRAVGVSSAVIFEGTVNTYVRSATDPGTHWPDLSAALTAGLRGRGTELSPVAKAGLLLGQLLRRRYGGSSYARAQQASRELGHAYDAVLREVDFLVLPTTPGLPHPVVADGVVDSILRGWRVLANTVPTNLTGHPAVSLPLASGDGLPVGLMAVAPRWAEARLLRLAATCAAECGTAPDVATHPCEVAGTEP